MKYIPIYCLAAALCVTQAQAQSPEEGTGLVCDNAQQAEQVASEYVVGRQAVTTTIRSLAAGR
jgi:hypothetical protein